MWLTTYRAAGVVADLGGPPVVYPAIQVPADRLVAATPETRLGGSTMKTWPDKDQDEILDYGFDWSTRSLGDDTINTTTATVVTGTIQVAQHAKQDLVGRPTGQTTVTWLKGGADGESCTIRLRAVTVAGRSLDETMTIRVATR